MTRSGMSTGAAQVAPAGHYGTLLFFLHTALVTADVEHLEEQQWLHECRKNSSGYTPR